jgi:hypothetical protein
MKTKEQVDLSIQGMTIQQQQQPEFRALLLDPSHVRVRIALAVYDRENRRYREKMTFKFRANKKGLATLIEQVRDRLKTLGT